MNRKLLALNVALGIGVIYAGVELHAVWVAAKARQAGMPGPPPKAAFVAPVAPLPQKPPVLAGTYEKVAQNDLFEAERNPNVPVPAPPPPPPPKDPPPLPAYHGMMDFGDPQGPIALITEASVPGHEEKHAGEMIGEFKLLTFDRQEMTLEWDGRTLHQRMGGGGSAPQARAAAPAGGPAPPAPGVIPGQAPEQTIEQPKPRGVELGPGTQMTDTVRACQAGDSSAAGTVNEGYRKEVNYSPMGAQCIWRAIGK